MMLNKKKSKSRSLLAVTLCTAMVFSLTACQKSPQSSLVVNKDLDKLIEQAADTSKKGLILDKEYDTWQTTIEDENLRVKVNVDAKVEVPKTDKMSVFRVSKQKVTQELLDSVRKELLGDTKLYDGAAVAKPTKAELEEEIAGSRRELEYCKDNPELAKEWQKRIDDMEAEYHSASDEISLKGWNTVEKLQSVTERYNENPSDRFYDWIHDLAPDGEVCYGVSDASDGNYASLYAVNSERYGNYISYRTGKHGYEHLGINGFGPMLSGGGEFHDLPEVPNETVKLTLENAVGIADEFLEKSGINHGETQFRYYEGDVTEEAIELAKEAEQGSRLSRTYYILTYTRYINGAFMTPESKLKYKEYGKGDSFKKMIWPMEKIEFRINDSGIVGFDYLSPIQITETMVDASAMKPFEEVRDTFQKMIVVTKANEYTEVKIDINQIILGYTTISEPDSFDTGLLVPVWDFIGTTNTVFNEKDGGAPKKENCLTINAIDGSVIDRELGY